MAYNIILTDGSGNIVIPIQQVSTNLASIPLVGREHSGYGQAVATAQIRMLENFAHTVAPSNPLIGQLWYDKGDKRLRVYDPTAVIDWKSIPNTLNELDDVDTNTPTDGQILKYNESEGVWKAADVAESTGVNTFAALLDTQGTELTPNSFLRVNSLGSAIQYIQNIPSSALSGTIDNARIPTNIVRQTRAINTGSGLAGGGNLSQNRTISVRTGDGIGTDVDENLIVRTGDGIQIVNGNIAVTADVVRTSRSINTGTGLSGGGNLTQNRTLSVDSTVVRTSGTQSIGGVKTFTGFTNITTTEGTGSHALNISRHNTEGIANAVLRLHMATSSSSRYLFRADNTNGARVVITGDGSVGINWTTPTEKLYVNGNVIWTGTLVSGDVPFGLLTNVPEISLSNLTNKDSQTLGLISGRRFVAALSNAAFGSIGTYVFGIRVNSTATAIGGPAGEFGVVEGRVYAGSTIYPSGGFQDGGDGDADNQERTHNMLWGGSTLQGQWRAMGRSNKAPTSARWRQTLFLRVS